MTRILPVVGVMNEPGLERRDAALRAARDTLAALLETHPRDLGRLPRANIAAMIDEVTRAHVEKATAEESGPA